MLMHLLAALTWCEWNVTAPSGCTYIKWMKCCCTFWLHLHDVNEMLLHLLAALSWCEWNINAPYGCTYMMWVKFYCTLWLHFHDVSEMFLHLLAALPWCDRTFWLECIDGILCAVLHFKSPMWVCVIYLCVKCFKTKLVWWRKVATWRYLGSFGVKYYCLVQIY